MGPAILQYGNMIRALDCPADPASNRKRIADLRLTSGSTPVHSDMIVWSREETVSGAALPILNALFGVIQYSIRLDGAKEEHLEAIRHWLSFSQLHRKVLLQGRFMPHHPESGYPLIEAENDGERIAVVYLPGFSVKAVSGCNRQYLINASEESCILVEVEREMSAGLYDTCGRKTGEVELKPGIVRVDVPPAGYAVLK